MSPENSPDLPGSRQGSGRTDWGKKRSGAGVAASDSNGDFKASQSVRTPKPTSGSLKNVPSHQASCAPKVNRTRHIRTAVEGPAPQVPCGNPGAVIGP